MEAEWVPQMMQALGIERWELPIIWDADFLYGPRTAAGADTYVLCEINVSSCFAIPDEAPAAIAELVLADAAKPMPIKLRPPRGGHDEEHRYLLAAVVNGVWTASQAGYASRLLWRRAADCAAHSREPDSRSGHRTGAMPTSIVASPASWSCSRWGFRWGIRERLGTSAASDRPPGRLEAVPWTASPGSSTGRS